LIVLTTTPTYHYSKLLFFPVIIWVAWRYLDHPTRRLAAALGVTTALAFLVRHDYGVYLGCGSVIAFVLSAAQVPSRASLSRSGIHAAASALTTFVVVAPGAALVQSRVALVDYVRPRTSLYEPPRQDVGVASLLDANPFRELVPASSRSHPGVIGFSWKKR